MNKNRDRIPVDTTPDGVRFRRERFDRSRNLAFGGLATISVLFAGISLFEHSKLKSEVDKVLEPPVPLTEVQKFRAELSSQTGGKDLLNDIDNLQNTKVTPEQFATTARQFYLLRKSCITIPRILTEPHFELGIAVYSEGDKDLLVTKSKGLTDVKDINSFNKSLENLNIQCDTLSPYLGSQLSELVLTGRQSKNLIADPNNPKTFGVEPGGYFSPRDKSIHIAEKNIAETVVFPHESMHRLVDKYKIASMKSAEQIMGSRLFNKWKSEGFVDNYDTVPGQKMSPELTKEMESIGLRGYSLYMYTNPNVKKYFDKNEQLKKLEKQLVITKKPLTINGKKITLGQTTDAENIKLQIAEIKKELDKIESKIPPPNEMYSTPIEIIYNINDPRFKDPKVKAMIGRYLDLMYAKTKIKIFSPKIRFDWMEMVKAVNKNINNSEKIKKIKADFDQKYPDLIK